MTAAISPSSPPKMSRPPMASALEAHSLVLAGPSQQFTNSQYGISAPLGSEGHAERLARCTSIIQANIKSDFEEILKAFPEDARTMSASEFTLLHGGHLEFLGANYEELLSDLGIGPLKQTPRSAPKKSRKRP
eukprot:NODE_6840_length_603_cov_10.794224_g5852_i0.p1 GENE.NODE_6840_length_603_cov_10.794224_g5852_i0~~NODE_6840_length_603_cov_10.794224_g5852_i0.p1  ORF type:complete len:133 (+),score=23.03 NODE_6840_length_603_cov_10.794224_g5852_i0:95-493(+)